MILRDPLNVPEMAEPLPSTFRLVKVHPERVVLVDPLRTIIEEERVISLSEVTLIVVSVTVLLSAENNAQFVPPLTVNEIELNEAEVPCNWKTAVGFVGEAS